MEPICCFKVQNINPLEVQSFMPRKTEEVRHKLAGLIGASQDEVVITRNTTEGMNFVVHGLENSLVDEFFDFVDELQVKRFWTCWLDC